LGGGGDVVETFRFGLVVVGSGSGSGNEALWGEERVGRWVVVVVVRGDVGTSLTMPFG